MLHTEREGRWICPRVRGRRERFPSSPLLRPYEKGGERVRGREDVLDPPKNHPSSSSCRFLFTDEEEGLPGPPAAHPPTRQPRPFYLSLETYAYPPVSYILSRKKTWEIVSCRCFDAVLRFTFEEVAQMERSPFLQLPISCNILGERKTPFSSTAASAGESLFVLACR